MGLKQRYPTYPRRNIGPEIPYPQERKWDQRYPTSRKGMGPEIPYLKKGHGTRDTLPQQRTWDQGPGSRSDVAPEIVLQLYGTCRTWDECVIGYATSFYSVMVLEDDYTTVFLMSSVSNSKRLLKEEPLFLTELMSLFIK